MYISTYSPASFCILFYDLDEPDVNFNTDLNERNEVFTFPRQVDNSRRTKMAEKKDEACAVPAFIARATNFQASAKIDNEGVIRQRHDPGPRLTCDQASLLFSSPRQKQKRRLIAG